jgi:hypothetical protein
MYYTEQQVWDPLRQCMFCSSLKCKHMADYDVRTGHNDSSCYCLSTEHIREHEPACVMTVSGTVQTTVGQNTFELVTNTLRLSTLTQ